MNTVFKVIRYVLLALLPLVVTETTHEELPHGEPNEDLVERHHGSKAPAKQ